MNNTCPTCGAVYNVAAKDVGRRIRCKKCGTGLEVTSAGLVLDGPAPAPVPDDDFPPAPAPRPSRGSGGGGLSLGKSFRDMGGVPTLFFGFGAFLVIVFLFQPIIGTAGVSRARGTVARLKLDWTVQERKLRKDKKGEEEITAARDKFMKENDPERADDDVSYATIGNQRSKWFEMYGMMFGFLFLMAGCLGYMMPDQTTVRRILGTVVLGAQMLIIFMIFAAGGGCAGGGPAGGAAVKGLE